MQREALELLQSTAINAAANQLETDMPVVITSGDARLQSLEQFEEKRTRFRGAFNTNSLTDFAEYVKKEPQGSTGFIDAEAMRAEVIFNLGDADNPGHGDNKAALSLKPTAAFKALQAAAGERHKQKPLSDWIEDWADNLQAKDKDGETIDLRKACQVVRSISIEQARKVDHSVGDMSASRSSMDSIEAKSSAGNLPASLFFTCTPYEGLQARTIELRVSLLLGSEEPIFSLRWLGQEQMIEDMAKEFKDVTAKALDGHSTLFIGNFNLGK